MARLSDKFSQHAKKLSAGGDAGTNGASGIGADLNGVGLQLTTGRDVLTELPLTQVEPDPGQPRRDLGDLTELAASIRALGLVQPIIVSVAGFERYRILAGERRFSAARIAGLEKIPAIVRSVEEHERLQLQIIENLHRKDLTPFEEARAYRALADQFGLVQEEIARRLGRSQESVSEVLRLLDLPSDIQEGYDEANRQAGGRITRSLLLEIARRPEGERQALWEEACRGGLTVKKARAMRPIQPTGEGAESTSNVGHAGGSGDLTPKEATPVRSRYPIQLDGGVTVTVEFEQTDATVRHVVDALERALAEEKQRLTSIS